jgi:hypothetical protein
MQDKFKTVFVLLILFCKETSFTVFYNCCLSINLSCTVMFNYSKCAECVYHDQFCVGLFSEFSEICLSKTEFKLSEVLHKQLFKLLIKITHLCKILKQSEAYVNIKTKCLALKLTDNNNKTENKNNLLTLSQLINSVSSFFWDSIFLSQNIKVLSCSS